MPSFARLSPAALDCLFAALHKDPSLAPAEYVRLHKRLTYWFQARKCQHASELADEAIDRAARKLLEMRDIGEAVDSVVAYAFRIAAFVWQEYRRKPQDQPLEGSPSDTLRERTWTGNENGIGNEAIHAALDRCLAELSSDQRQLVLGVLLKEKGEKKHERQRLAQEFGMTMAGLYTKAFRIRRALEECINRQLAAGLEAEGLRS
jgi:DNA-directed RNA polymerase specialized sigma24 family protein